METLSNSEMTPAHRPAEHDLPLSAVSKKPPAPLGRIHFLDEIRGLDILLMVAFHACYVGGWLFEWEWARAVFLFFKPVESFFAGIFIFICGISCHLSHNNWKRGLMVAGLAAVISLTLWLVMPGQMIRYGILHFLATAILLFALCRPLLEKVPVLPGLIACGLLLWLTWHLPVEDGSFFGIKGVWELAVPESITSLGFLYPLGLGEGHGVDYFPILPWIFCFLGGSFIGKWVKQGKMPAWMYKSRVPFFSWAGKHTLIIYILHQPVAFGLFWLFQTVFTWIMHA